MSAYASSGRKTVLGVYSTSTAVFGITNFENEVPVISLKTEAFGFESIHSTMLVKRNRRYRGKLLLNGKKYTMTRIGGLRRRSSQLNSGLLVYDMFERKILRTTQAIDEFKRMIEISDDFFAAAVRTKVVVFNFSKFEVVHTFKSHRRSIYCLISIRSVVENRYRFVSAADDLLIKVYEISTCGKGKPSFKIIKGLRGHEQQVNGLSQNGVNENELISSGCDWSGSGEVCVWDLNEGNIKRKYSIAQSWDCCFVQPMRGIGNQLVVGNRYADKIHFYSAKKGNLTKELLVTNTKYKYSKNKAKGHQMYYFGTIIPEREEDVPLLLIAYYTGPLKLINLKSGKVKVSYDVGTGGTPLGLHLGESEPKSRCLILSKSASEQYYDVVILLLA